jgi:glucose-6-phosphate isomerase
MKIHFDNLFRISPEHGISKEEFNGTGALIGKRLVDLKKHGQGFYDVIDDEAMVGEIENFVAETTGKFDAIVVLGIGGSAQGAVCLQQSLLHAHRNEQKNRKKPRLFVINNIDPIMIGEVEDVIDLGRTLFLLISKSGTTPEAMITYLYFRKKVTDSALKPADHFVFVTDIQGGALAKSSKKKK